jgi:hypothetical protein
VTLAARIMQFVPRAPHRNTDRTNVAPTISSMLDVR